MSGSSTSRLIAAGLLLLYCAAGQEKAPLT
jgi:hypothetical protein